MSSCATVLSRFPFSFIHIPASNCRTLFLYKNTLPNTSITLLFVSLFFLSGQLKFNPKVQNSDAEQTEILSGETQMQHFRLPQQKQRHENENKTDIKSFHRTRVGKNRYYRSEKEQARWRFKPKETLLSSLTKLKRKRKRKSDREKSIRNAIESEMRWQNKTLAATENLLQMSREMPTICVMDRPLRNPSQPNTHPPPHHNHVDRLPWPCSQILLTCIEHGCHHPHIYVCMYIHMPQTRHHPWRFSSRDSHQEIFEIHFRSRQGEGSKIERQGSKNNAWQLSIDNS